MDTKYPLKARISYGWRYTKIFKPKTIARSGLGRLLVGVLYAKEKLKKMNM
jgi:hypothetical protein